MTLKENNSLFVKNIFFLSGLPRAGNTLLGSLINQNNKIKVTPNTILCDVLYQLFILKENLIFENFPDHQSFNNVLNNVFNNYYKDWKCNHVIDRGPWGTPVNLFILKQIIKKPKFIILYRPVVEVLASFVKIEKPQNIEKHCSELMDEENGVVGKYLFSIKNLIENKEDYIVIHYKNLCKNPIVEIKKIYKFLNVTYKKTNIKKLKQFSVNDIFYNDSVLKGKLHEIRTDKVSYNEYDIKKILPNKVIKKYSNLDIL